MTYVWRAADPTAPPGSRDSYGHYYYDRIEGRRREERAQEDRIRREQWDRWWHDSMKKRSELERNVETTMRQRAAAQRPAAPPAFRVSDVPSKPSGPLRMTPDQAAQLAWTPVPPEGLLWDSVAGTFRPASGVAPAQSDWDVLKSKFNLGTQAPMDWRRQLGIEPPVPVPTAWDILESAAVRGPMPIAKLATEIAWNAPDNRWHQPSLQPAAFPLFTTFQGPMPQSATAVDLSALQATVTRVPEAPAYVGQFPEFDASFNRQVALGNAVEYQRVRDMTFHAPRFVDFHT